MIIRGSLLRAKAAGVWTTYFRLAPRLMNGVISILPYTFMTRTGTNLFTCLLHVGVDWILLDRQGVKCGPSVAAMRPATKFHKNETKWYEIWRKVVSSTTLQNLNSKFPYTAILEILTSCHDTSPVLSNYAWQIRSLFARDGLCTVVFKGEYCEERYIN